MAIMTRGALYHRIDSMRQKYGIRGAFDPYAFVKTRDILLTQHRFTNERLHGILVRAGRKYGIILDTRLTPAQQRFTLTHELVHFELHYGEPSTATFHDQGVEYQADEGAAELLMPYRDFIPRMAFMRRKFLKNQTAALSFLASFYRLDCEMVRRRLLSLSYELDLYQRGVPVCELTPVSYRRKRALGMRESRFGKTLRPVTTDKIDIFCDTTSGAFF